MKKVMIGGVAVIVVVGVGLFFLWSNVGSIIKAAVEKFGSEILKAEVTLDEADVSVSSGEGGLKGLVVGNPAGFNSDNAFRMGSVNVRVDTGTVTGDTITIHEIVVEAPEVTYEFGSGSSNLQTLKKNADDYAAAHGGGGGGSASSDEGAGKKLIIEHVYVRDARLNVAGPFLQGKSFGTTLPEIHLTDIGKDEGGAGPGEVAEKVVTAITTTATKAVASIDFGDLSGQVQDRLKDIGGVAGQAAQDMMKRATEGASGASDLLKQGTEGAGGVGDKLKGLFGGDKK